MVQLRDKCVLIQFNMSWYRKDDLEINVTKQSSPSIWKVLGKSEAETPQSVYNKDLKNKTKQQFGYKVPLITLCDFRLHHECKMALKRKLSDDENHIFHNENLKLMTFKNKENGFLQQKRYKDRKRKRISIPNPSVTINVFACQMTNLKRNCTLRPYSSVLLPFTAIEESSVCDGLYREQFLELAFEAEAFILTCNFPVQIKESDFEEEAFIVACNFLTDFCAKYELSERTFLQLLQKLFEKIDSDSINQINMLKRSLLFICQKQNANIPTLDIDVVFTGESVECLSVFLKCLEINLFSTNMCDPKQIRHSKAHLLLSWDKGRQNLLKTLEFLGFLLTKPITYTILSKVYAVQGLVALGLMTSILNELNALKCVASRLSEMYSVLKNTDEKILLLSTIELPSLLVLVVNDIIGQRFSVLMSNDDYPSLRYIIDHYFTPLPKQGSDILDQDECEEYVLLLYFLLWGTLENIKQRTGLSYRVRLLDPDLERDIPTIQSTPDVINFSIYLQDMCKAFTSKTSNFLCFIYCQLDVFIVTESLH